MSRVTKVINRNGEVVPFRRSRVVRAILAAVRSAGSKDEWVADKLADMVVYFLDMQHGERPQPPTAEDIDDTIEKALLSSPDLAAIAAAFIRGRSMRREIASLDDTEAADGPRVSHAGWNRARITAALMRENGLTMPQAREVAEAVEQRVLRLDASSVTTGLIRELTDTELLSRGLARETSIIPVPRYDLEQWLFPGDDTDTPPAADQAELADRAGRRVLAAYTLQSVLDAPSREAHERGDLHFEGLHAPAALATVRLDAESLLRAGAGFGMQRMAPESAAGVAAALARIASMVRDAAAINSGPVTLKGLDRALAKQAGDDANLLDRGQISDGVRLLAAMAPHGLSIECGPQASAARDLVARTLIDVLAGSEGALRGKVSLELAVSAGAFGDPARRALIDRAASAAAWCGVPAFRLRETLATGGGGGLFDDSAGPPHGVLLSRVCVNLLRPAMDASSIENLLERLDALLALAARGLACRVRYLERVAMRDLPEPAPAPARMLRALVGGSRDVGVTPVGLWLAAARFGDGESRVQRNAQQILSYAAFKFRELAARQGLQGRLCGRCDEAAPARFARLDAALVQARDPESPLRLALAQPMSAAAQGGPSAAIAQRLDAESPLHALLDRDAEVTADESMTAQDVVAALRNCLSEHGPRPARFAVRISSRTCRDCGNAFPAHRDACPVCGSQAWAVPPGQKSLFA
ncbi:MAG: hypothetical protein KF696_04815 [Planctomycetes bacterium]|nr:hypothetical protein [Planctomycetota bacterium]MCW8134295.1 hypothetical protein [Planctomycetota bacterium]